MFNNESYCPADYVVPDHLEAKCCENVLGDRWISITHPKNTQYNVKPATLFSEHKITNLTVWLMKAARWVAEGKNYNGNQNARKKKKQKVSHANS